eukprot:g21231.t1
MIREARFPSLTTSSQSNRFIFCRSLHHHHRNKRPHFHLRCFPRFPYHQLRSVPRRFHSAGRQLAVRSVRLSDQLTTNLAHVSPVHLCSRRTGSRAATVEKTAIFVIFALQVKKSVVEEA